MSATSSAPLVIIGSGLAGINLAKAWRKCDQKTPLVVITQDDGCLYSKPMLSTALAKQVTPEELIQSTPDELRASLDCTLITHTTINQLNRATQTITTHHGQVISYSALVFAVGASPATLKIDGDASRNILTINNRLDYLRFRQQLNLPNQAASKHIAIIGGGLVGCELANDLSSTHHRVSLLNASEGLLSTFIPHQAGKKLASCLGAAGVDVRLKTTVVAASRDAERTILTMSDGSTLVADMVLAATGLVPNIGIAKNAGLQTARGIVTNQYLETSDKHIFALGDCATVCGHTLLYVMPLMNSARALAKTLAGERTAVSYPAMPVIIKTTCWPTVVLPPPEGAHAQWQLIQSTPHGEEWHGLVDGRMVGFMLSGDQVDNKNTLAKMCPALI